MPERPARPAPQTYDEALTQVRALEAELDDMTRSGMQLGQTRQLRTRGGPGESWRKDAFPARLTAGRGAIEADLAAARADLERLRPAPAERQPAAGTSEAARAYLERLGLGHLYELGSTRGAPDLTPPPPMEPVRAETRAAQTQKQALSAAQERFNDFTSWDDSLVDVDQELKDTRLMEDDGFRSIIFDLTDEEAETLSKAAQNKRGVLVAPVSALPKRYADNIARSSSVITPNDLEITFNDRFDPATPREDQDFFPSWNLRDRKDIEKRLRNRLQEVERPTTVTEGLGHRLHTVRAATFQALLNAAGVNYRMPKKPQIASEYYYIDALEDFPDTLPLKVRFADHSRQSGLHERADFNLDTETTDAQDVSQALRAILSNSEYAPNGAAVLRALDAD
jgi:hypothetical protein